jgi:membrane protease YdiL (CAAX protease family)
VAIEEKRKKRKPFLSAFEHVFDNLQEDELKITEMKTKELTEGKKIFYPDLLQSFLMVLAAFLIGWVVSLTVQAIALGEENVEVRSQWLNQNYLWIILLSGLLTVGGPLAYAIWQRRKTSANAPIFSFRSVPPYVYRVILLIVIFSGFWLEPLSLFFPPFQEFRAAYNSQLEGFSPLLLTLLTIFAVILKELLFRGIILKGLLMTTTPLRAILWSSLFCAAFSFPYFAVIFIISIMQGWLYWKTRSLYPPIFLIGIGYVIRYIATLFADQPKDFFFHFKWWEYVDQNLMIYIPLVVGSFLLTAALFYYLHKRLSAASS